MMRYKKYKPSGVECIGDIPEHWEVKRLKYISYMKGRIGWQNLRASEFTFNADDPFLITGMNFKNGKINWEEVYHISTDRYSEAPEIQLQVGDVLMTKDGTIGKLLFVDHLPGLASLNSHLLLLRPLKNKYEPKYLYFLLESVIFKNYVEIAKTGTTFFGITQEAVGDFFTILPTPEEQTAIANYLDKKTSRIDTLIEKKQRLIELLKEERTAIINHAVTKGINSKAKLKPSGIEWLGDIPKHWEVKKLKYVAEKVQTGSTPPSNQEEYYEEQVNWFTPSDFSDSLRLTNSKRKISESAIKDGVVKLFPANSVLLIGIGATLGKVGYIEEPASSNQQINAIYFDRLEKAKYCAYFLHVNQNNIVSLSNAATLAILNQSQTKDVPCIVPSSDEEMEDIIEFIEKMENVFITTISKIEREIELMREYRTALISEVVTGKIKVI